MQPPLDGHIVMERAIYWGNGRVEGTASAGMPRGAFEWHLPEGTIGGNFDNFMMLSNPTSVPVTVDVTLYVENVGKFTLGGISGAMAGNGLSLFIVPSAVDVGITEAAAGAVLAVSSILSLWGITNLIARGYGTMAWGFFFVYLLPIVTIGLYRVSRARAVA